MTCGAPRSAPESHSSARANGTCFTLHRARSADLRAFPARRTGRYGEIGCGRAANRSKLGSTSSRPLPESAKLQVGMSAHTAPLNRQTALRFVRAIRDLLTSEVRRQAIGLLLLLLVFALSVSGLNVVNSYVGRDLMTAIADRDMSGFVRLGILYVCVFVESTGAAVLYRFCEERLGLLWRSWLTKRVTARYLDRRTYLRMIASAD